MFAGTWVDEDGECDYPLLRPIMLFASLLSVTGTSAVISGIAALIASAALCAVGGGALLSLFFVAVEQPDVMAVARSVDARQIEALRIFRKLPNASRRSGFVARCSPDFGWDADMAPSLNAGGGISSGSTIRRRAAPSRSDARTRLTLGGVRSGSGL